MLFNASNQFILGFFQIIGPLLSGRDIRALLNQFLPRRDTTLEAVLRQMEVRHRKRQAAIDSAYRKQQLNE